MRDNDQLEVLLHSASLDYVMEGLCKTSDVVLIEVGGWFIESNDLLLVSEISLEF